MDTYATVLKIHVTARHPQNQSASKTEKAKRPELASDVSDEGWSYFKARLDQYKKATGLAGEDILTHLMEFCSEQGEDQHSPMQPR